MLSSIICMISCNSSDEEASRVPAAGEIYFTSAITRATAANFEDNDAISVFAFKNGTGFTADMYASNRKYIYANNQFVASDANNAIISPNDNTPLAYQAIYPYKLEAGSVFEFSVVADQSSGSNYTQSDLMTASTIATTEQIPNLRFGHRLSNIVVNLSFDIVPGGDVKVDFQNVMTVASADLTTGTFKGVGGMMAVRAASNGTSSFKAILPPQVIEGGADLISLHVGDKNILCKMNKKTEWKSGIQYIYDVHVDREDNVTFTALINPWEEDVEEPVIPSTGKKLKRFEMTGMEDDGSIYSIDFTYDNQGRMLSWTGINSSRPEEKDIEQFTYSGNTITQKMSYVDDNGTEAGEMFIFKLNSEGNAEKMQFISSSGENKIDIDFTYTNGYLIKSQSANSNPMNFSWEDGLLMSSYTGAPDMVKYYYSSESPSYKLPMSYIGFFSSAYDDGIDLSFVSFLNILGKNPAKLPTGPEGSQNYISYIADADNYVTKIIMHGIDEEGESTISITFTYY